MYNTNTIILEGNTIKYDIDRIDATDGDEINILLEFYISPVLKKISCTSKLVTLPDPRKRKGDLLKDAEGYFKKEASFFLNKYAYAE